MEVRRTARARHVAGMPRWWSSRLVSMLRLFQRDGPLSGLTPLLLDHGWTLEPRSCLSECRRDRSHRARPWRRDAYAALPQPLILILSSAMITWSNATSPTPSPLDAFSAVRSWVGCTTNMSGFDLRQAQPSSTLRATCAWLEARPRARAPREPQHWRTTALAGRIHSAPPAKA